jgi:hypothetical protein
MIRLYQTVMKNNPNDTNVTFKYGVPKGSHDCRGIAMLNKSKALKRRDLREKKDITELRNQKTHKKSLTPLFKTLERTLPDMEYYPR